MEDTKLLGPSVIPDVSMADQSGNMCAVGSVTEEYTVFYPLLLPSDGGSDAADEYRTTGDYASLFDPFFVSRYNDDDDRRVEKTILKRPRSPTSSKVEPRKSRKIQQKGLGNDYSL